MVRFNAHNVTEMIVAPITAAIMPAKVPKKTAMRNIDARKSTPISKYRTFLMLNLNNRNNMESAEKTPAITKNVMSSSNCEILCKPIWLTECL